jgi:6-phosphogluconolactonase
MSWSFSYLVRFGLLAGLVAMVFAATVRAESIWVYIGTGGAPAKGIYRCELDLSTGKLSQPELAVETANPGFLAIHPNKKFLYATGVMTKDGKNVGALSAFAIDPKTGNLTLLNQQSSGGAGPCHVVVDKEGKNVLGANYGGGSACIIPIGADGKLGDGSSVVQHKGSSVNKQRQEGPHAHSVNLDPAGKYAFVADLGLDKVMIYKLDPAKGTLTANDPPAFDTAPGAGPRHFAFHPSGKWAYVINELNSTLTAMSYDADKGVLKEVNTLTTLPKETPGNSTAEVVVHPSGKFVYGSNRGHNSIAVFTVDETTGKIAAAGHQAEGINTPRNFNIDPSGQYLVVGNQGSDSIVVFKIDQKTGQLTPTGSKVEVGKPICIKFLAKP